jgi:hypothetical protein
MNFTDYFQKWMIKMKKPNKSKMVFITLLCILSKLAEQAKIHILHIV